MVWIRHSDPLERARQPVLAQELLDLARLVVHRDRLEVVYRLVREVLARLGEEQDAAAVRVGRHLRAGGLGSAGGELGQLLSQCQTRHTLGQSHRTMRPSPCFRPSRFTTKSDTSVWMKLLCWPWLLIHAAQPSGVMTQPAILIIDCAACVGGLVD